MKRTKMVFTLGPSTDRPGVLEKLIRSGMDCARLNFSHGSHAEHARRIHQLRQTARRLGAPVAVLMDLAGPKLRVGCFTHGGIKLTAHSKVRVTTRALTGCEGLIPVTYKNLAKEVRAGEKILLDDGLIRLRVLKTENADIICRVETGGFLKDKKGFNLPGLELKVPALTAKDRQDLAFGLGLGVDFVALSFVRREQEMLTMRRLIKQAGVQAATIAKIEKPQAINRLEAIISVSDGVMIARGDLGVELNPEEVPVLQKRIIRLANEQGKFVITATQMLQSMMDNPSPTRAEATDVANAVFDGTDAVMLSGETAAGRYPDKAAAMMFQIGQKAEQTPEYNRLVLQPPVISREDELVAAGVHLAEKLNAKALAVFTTTGKTARLVSRQRPLVPVYALAHSEQVQRQLQLNWGLQVMLLKAYPSLETIVEKAGAFLSRQGLVKSGDLLVILASTPKGTRTNFIKMHVIGGK